MRHSNQGGAFVAFMVSFAAVVVLAGAGLAVALERSGASSEPSQVPSLRLRASDLERLEQEIASLTPTGTPAPEIAATDKEAYLGAIQAHLECVQRRASEVARDRGLAVRFSVHLDGLSADDFEGLVSYRATPANGDAASAGVASRVLDDVELECRHAHLDAVELAYQARLMSDGGFVDSVSGSFSRCLEAAGLRAGNAEDARALLVRAASVASSSDDGDPTGDCIARHPAVNTIQQTRDAAG